MALAMMSQPQPALRVVPKPSEQPRLLVIDDDPVNRELMRRLFDQDYNILCVASGRAGLEAIASSPVDVVLLDIMMPEMNGFEVLEHLRRDPETEDLPVILVSALTESESVVQGLQLGANDYLTKPVNIHIARARLETQIKLKRLMDERKRAVIELERLNEVRERFFRIASHDLKNPINNLRLAFHELGYYIPDTPEIEAVKETIYDTLGGMQDLIEEFLDIAAMRNGQLEMAMRYVDLNEIVWQVATQYASAASQKQINLHVAAASGMVLADVQRLAQAIGNLTSNALKYSPAGSTVTLWTQTCDGRVRIFVGDEGQGIPADEQSRLFHEFARLSPRPTAGEHSTGLGLWIVKHLTHMMGGTVGVESVVGEGSVFWLEFDLCEGR